MASKSVLLQPTGFENFGDLYRFLRAAPLRQSITSKQAETLADVLDANLPAEVTLEQRTPKGTVYVYLDGLDYGTVNQAGRYIAPRKSEKFLTVSDLKSRLRHRY